MLHIGNAYALAVVAADQVVIVVAEIGRTDRNDKPNAGRDKLRKAGFYSEWKGKFGEKGWSTLEAAVGQLS